MTARRVRRKSREERKAELMAYIEQKADELLDWQERQGTTDLWTMEEKVEQVGRAVQGKLVETLVESQQRGLSVTETCPTCGGRLEYWGERQRDLETSVGPIKLNRPYYYCRHCQAGFFPSGRRIEAEPPRVE
jgi:DNA repair exonuclease SbcCD ATPase subunit